MKEFEVQVYELHVQQVTVTAEDENDAIRRVRDGEGRLVDNGCLFVEQADRYGLDPDDAHHWTVSNDLLDDDGRVAGICEVNEI